MADEAIILTGDAVDDERQLDGRRHLTIDLVDESDEWFCTTHLIFGAKGGLDEAEIEVEGPGRIWSGVLQEVLALSEEGPLELRARFAELDGAEAGLELSEAADAAGFTGHLSLPAAD